MDNEKKKANPAMHFDNTEDYLFRPEEQSIKTHIRVETIFVVIAIAVLFAGFCYAAKYFWQVPYILTASTSVSFLYLGLMLFKLRVVTRALTRPFYSVSAEKLATLKDRNLPIYTILIPLRREERVIPQIIKSMSAIDYPKDKLDIIITVEAYDHETRNAIRQAKPPSYFKILVLPDVRPKTKPKALNVAFRHAKGRFLVIYDAEIVPDPDQLKKAVIAFNELPTVACLQTRLEHYNAQQNILTKLFNAEFSFYYDLFLPGLQQSDYPIPLSGHSTHFRKEALTAIGAWDPYNVAEDCDMGIHLARAGYKTDILDSVSREEATSDVWAWVMQRTRWMKGFIQTSIVHLRHPITTKNDMGGWDNFFAFLWTVPGTVFINIVNLLYWGLLIGWVMFRPKMIQELFPGPILYISVFSFVLGNTIFTFLNLVGAYKRKKYSIVKFCLLSPLYWMLLAMATVRASLQILIKPHRWEKTKHNIYPVQHDYASVT